MVRLLAGLDIANVADSTQTFAEKLSQWVAWTDAISLSSALDGGPAGRPAGAKSGGSSEANTVIEQFNQARNEMMQSIAHDAMFAGAPAGKARPAAAAVDLDFAVYRRHYQASQRVMDERVSGLRAHVRASAAQVSPALSRLAALDTAMEQALGAHQRRLLASVPVMLEKRFKGLRKAQLDAQGTGHGPDAFARHTSAEAVGNMLQHVLQAELELRLQPVQGMIDAIGGNAARPA